MARILLLAFLAVFVAQNNCAAEQEIPPIPNLSDWEEYMKDNARIIAAQPETANCGDINEGFIWYYDGISIFHQIAEYTKDAAWLKVAAKIRKYYRDDYVIGCKKYSVDGWRNFTRGLRDDWLVLKDDTSRKTAIEMAKKGKFSQLLHTADYDKFAKNVDLSREIAYAINAWHFARDLGAPEFSRRDPYLEVAYSHLDIWKIYLEGYPGSNYPGEQTAKYQTFMFALTAEALIRVYERPDTSADDKEKIFTKIYELAKITYNKLYNESKHGFTSNTANPNTIWGSVDLLVVPLYGWLWNQTGDKYFLEAGDKIWKNWTIYGWPQIAGWGGKQFSQNYHWSFDYVRWRSSAPVPNPLAIKIGKGRSEAALQKILAFPKVLNLSGTMKFTLDRLLTECEVEISNAAGEKVIVLNSKNKTYLEWDCKDENKTTVPAGAYTYLIRSKDGAEKTGNFEIKTAGR